MKDVHPMKNHRGDPMQLEVRDLRLVHAVADHGSLTRAGMVLHLTQSALSHQLADLETRVGAPLFSRAGKRMVLTPAGERLRDHARAILTALGRAEDDLRSASRQREALLRLSTECYTCYHWLPRVLREFERDFPRVETRIVAEATRRPVPALLRGLLDLAVVSTPIRDRRIVLTPLFRDELVAVTAPDHPWAGRPFVTPEDFASEHLIGYNLPRQENTFYQQVLVPGGHLPRQVSDVQLTEAIVELVKAGLGVSVLARWAVAPQLRSGEVAGLPITERGVHRQWSAAYLNYKIVPRHLAAFVTLLGHWCPTEGNGAALPSPAARRSGRRPARPAIAQAAGRS
jgi:LysR family transcriptional regulator for metE and metH